MKTKCCNTSNVHKNESGIFCMNSGCDNYLGTVELTDDHRQLKKSVVISMMSMFILCSFNDFSMENKEAHISSIMMPSVQEIPLTVENLEAELTAQNIICSREVLAQIKLESGNLSSFLLKRANNMLGMRFPYSRKTTACGIYVVAQDTIIYGTQQELKKYRKTNNYAVFSSWQEAVADYKLWQEACFKVTERYLAFLGNVYAEDSLYTKKIKQVAATQDLK
jgi:hypothetical protein